MSWLCRNGYWGGGGLPAKLKQANRSLRTWLGTVNMRISIKRLTVENLVLKSGVYPETGLNICMFLAKFL